MKMSQDGHVAMTSYLEAVAIGADFEAYNRHCQLTRVLCESQFSYQYYFNV